MVTLKLIFDSFQMTLVPLIKFIYESVNRFGTINGGYFRVDPSRFEDFRHFLTRVNNCKYDELYIN